MPAFGLPSVALWAGAAAWFNAQGPPLTLAAAMLPTIVHGPASAPAVVGGSSVVPAKRRAPTAPMYLVRFTGGPFRRPSRSGASPHPRGPSETVSGTRMNHRQHVNERRVKLSRKGSIFIL